jgi:release factor glutamine methyltransferase
MTAAALHNALKSALTRGGAENPAGDALAVIENLLGFSRIDLVTRGETEVADSITEKAMEMARRRVSGEPIQYIVGSWSFMGRAYRVGEGVLIPRDDTEVVVNAAIRRMSGIACPKIVDLCAGSGIIAVTLYHGLDHPSVSAVEKSGAAFTYLQENAALNHADIRLIHADLRDCTGDFPDRSLDLIVSNPPYIKSAEISTLQSEVQYEPRLALDGGASGYDFYEMILGLWTAKLKPGGCIALELGEEQFDYVSGLLRAHGYTDIQGDPDISGTIRAVTAVLSAIKPKN